MRTTPNLSDTIALIGILKVYIHDHTKGNIRICMMDIAVHRLTSGASRNRHVTVDEAELWSRTKNVLDNSDHVWVCVEVAMKPFGIERRDLANVSGIHSLVPAHLGLLDIHGVVFYHAVI